MLSLLGMLFVVHKFNIPNANFQKSIRSKFKFIKLTTYMIVECRNYLSLL